MTKFKSITCKEKIYKELTKRKILMSYQQGETLTYSQCIQQLLQSKESEIKRKKKN